MPWDDDDADDAARAGPPLPPDDRLWRHPSELGPHATAAAPVAVGPRSPTWAVALGAAVAGALLTSVVMAATDALPARTVERAVVEKVAMTPMVSSPMLRGEHGVQALTRHLGPAIVRLHVEHGDGSTTGSGVLFRDDGLVLTSAHLVDGARSVAGVLIDGRRLAAEVVGVDDVTEVAVVDLVGDGHAVAVLGSVDGLRVGATAVVVGTGLGVDPEPAATTGVVTALEHQARTLDGGWLHGMIQTDAPLSRRWGGAALVDERGAVVGVATRFAVDGDGDFGFATPIDVARRVAVQLVATGRADHAWLGVAGEDLTLAHADRLDLDGGAVVRELSDEGPAALAGLLPGDVITAVDGTTVGSMSELVALLLDRAPGESVELRYLRGGDDRRATVTLGARP